MMTTETLSTFETFLAGHDEADWAKIVRDLLPSIHEVDRNATEIWFAFFPLALLRAFEQSDDPERLAAQLLMQGRWLLRDQIDTSHAFLYGHRFWPEVKRAVEELASAADAPANLVLASQIRETAGRVAAALKVEQSLTIGITAVAFMTLRQVGLAAFKAAPGAVSIDKKHVRRSPEDVVRERARDDRQGLFGFLRTEDKRWTVVWDEHDEERRFKVLHLQEVASGAATDKRPWHELDTRCTINEGPIPVQCRSASCGTCWVGVLGGAEKLTEVAARERRKMPEFGYLDTDETRPLIRLSCQAQATGALSIVIPPWNGVFGKYLKRLEESGDTNAGTNDNDAETNVDDAETNGGDDARASEAGA
ncbi:MAG TPA: 2Fe-2S iron-sulfur cluster-binding protein [Pyrinomonadaceae bacterium]|nr:2Fe-2S iron-sulfur cluster-binding protein [Pyrinomonadaceae bacterium]